VMYGNIVSQSSGAADSFFVFDALGSTRQLANSTGSLTDSYLYDSFGSGLVTSGSTINWLRYNGREGSEFDVDLVQYFIRARYYDPSTGRFLSRDPVGVNPIDANLYPYAKNRPSMLTDPSGLQCAGESPTDTRGNSCCNLFLRLFVQSPQYKAYLATLSKRFGGCPPPNIQCKMCASCPGLVGETLYPWVFLCDAPGFQGTDSNIYRTIVHELTHYAFACPGSSAFPSLKNPNALTCFMWERDELLSRMCAGQCSDLSTCMAYALGAYPLECAQFDSVTRPWLTNAYNTYSRNLSTLCPITYNSVVGMLQRLFVDVSKCCL
jgi:RHS repeat-associated protein